MAPTRPPIKRRRRPIGWRAAKKVSRHGGLTRAGEKAAMRRHEVAVKAATRAEVWARSAGLCEYCGATEAATRHEADEVIPRSLTRNWPPEIRFGTKNTARACRRCHRLKTDHKIGVCFLSGDGMDGDIDIVDRTGTVTYRLRRRRLAPGGDVIE